MRLDVNGNLRLQHSLLLAALFLLPSRCSIPLVLAAHTGPGWLYSFALSYKPFHMNTEASQRTSWVKKPLTPFFLPTDYWVPYLSELWLVPFLLVQSFQSVV